MKNRLSVNTILNFLFWLALVFQDAGTFGFLPLNLFQIIELTMLLVICISNKKYNISKPLLFLLMYIGVITIISPFDFESVKSFGFLCLSLFLFYSYLEKNGPEMPMHIIYSAAAFLAIYGVIQEISYVFDIPAIYDISRYGFALNGSYAMPNGLIRAMSLYAEPSHVSAIMGLGLLIGMVGKKEQIKGVKLWKTVLICIFSLFTQSTVVYMTVIMAVICFIFFYQERLSKKIKWMVAGILTVLFISITQKNMVLSVIGKLSQFRTLQTDTGNDLSALAIVSNLRIAIEKMKDGYLFGTGLDSHRRYYGRYIGRIYSSLFMYLNTADCSSLYIRIFSEFGIVGIIGFLVLLTRKFVRGIRIKDKYMVIAVLMFAVAIMRNGSYVELLTQVLFVWIFFIREIRQKDIYNNKGWNNEGCTYYNRGYLRGGKGSRKN